VVLNIVERYNVLSTAAYRLDASDRGGPSPLLLTDSIGRPLTLPEVIRRAKSNRN